MDMISPGLCLRKLSENKSVIAIDAGGTNFRSRLVTFDANGSPTISDMEKGDARDGSRRSRIFETIASFLDHLKNKADRIGFCFSYAMSITPEGDGKVIQFSKEIKAKEVIGSLVGESLSDALVERGWNRPKKVVLLNDTTAALLAGASAATNGKEYDSYVGFILEPNERGLHRIRRDTEDTSLGAPAPESQIIVCESGSATRSRAAI